VAAIITPSSLRRMPSAFKCLINALAGQVARNIRAAAGGPLPNQDPACCGKEPGKSPALHRRKRIIEK